MDLPISIQDLDDPNKPKQRPEWIHHPGVYYNKHLEKVMAIDKTRMSFPLGLYCEPTFIESNDKNGN